MKSLVFFLEGLLLTLSLQAQTNPEPGRYSWPGMTAYDVVVCARLVMDAQFVQVQGEDGKMVTVPVHEARGWKKDNGFYGLKINGQVVEENHIYLFYWGRIVNLQTLFSYGSDALPAQGSPDFDRIREP